MDCQDWKEVTLVKKKAPPPKPNLPPKSKRETDDPDKPKTISKQNGKLIENARTAMKLSREQLAAQISITPNDLAKYENGKAIPDNKIMQKFRTILKIKFDK